MTMREAAPLTRDPVRLVDDALHDEGLRSDLKLYSTVPAAALATSFDLDSALDRFVEQSPPIDPTTVTADTTPCTGHGGPGIESGGGGPGPAGAAEAAGPASVGHAGGGGSLWSSMLVSAPAKLVGGASILALGTTVWVQSNATLETDLAGPRSAAPSMSMVEGARPAEPTEPTAPPDIADRAHAPPLAVMNAHHPRAASASLTETAAQMATDSRTAESPHRPARPRSTARSNSPRRAAQQRRPATKSTMGRMDRARKEAEMIARARRLLDTRPRAALDLLQRCARRYPHGLLKLERQGLEIVAMFAVNQPRAAARRARRYLDAHPKGPLAATIRRELERK